jgi:hypothetical protein
MEVSGQLHASAALSPGMSPPICTVKAAELSENRLDALKKRKLFALVEN